MPRATPAVLDAEQAKWMTHGATTITVASCNAARKPSLGQAVGFRMDAARKRITLFLVEQRNLAVIADLRAGGQVAVVFTESVTTRSLQLKAQSARETPLAAGDPDRIAAYVGATALAWAPQGVPEAFTRTLLAREPGPVVSFELTPEIAFDQTPGPRAGTALGPQS